MKRYLIGKMYTEKDFLEYDNESYCDINFQMLVAILLKKMKSKMQTASKTIKGISGMRDFLAQLENMPFSLEYMFDIWNEIFLKLLYISNEKEKLFPEEKKISIYLEEAERVFCNAQLIENMESTINNRKKANATKKDYIFDMEDIKSTKKDFEIKICGAEIVRLWLGEKDFRKLFIVTESRYEKYEPQSIIDTIDGKVSRDDSYIILEKCVGLHFGFYLQLFIVENFPEIKYKQLENIINLLSKYEGIDSRIYILYNIGEELSKCSNAEQKSQKIEACCICLRTLIPIYQKLYVDTVDTIIDEYIKHYSYDTIVGLVDGKRKIVKYFKKLRHQTDDNAYPYYYSVEGIIRDIERKLEDQDDPTIILENTKDSLLAIKNRFDYLMQKRSYYERPDYIFQLPGWWRQLRNSNLDLIERSQAQIINKSHKKYKE